MNVLANSGWWIGLTLALVVGESKPSKPNFIIVLCDNLGYGDLGCFGCKVQRTPNVDRMASEGMRLTDFYVGSGVCSPSRAALMTGCYPLRVGMHAGEGSRLVLQPVAHIGLNPNEITIAEVLKSTGYATGIIGKWHLGDQPDFLPTRQGFDSYFGIPYSDDMTPRPEKPWPPLPLMRNDRVVEAPVDRAQLTKRYTDEAVAFITGHRDRPFFLYLAHAMPGSTDVPFASAEFAGKSSNGAWGDSVEEIDASLGRILAELGKLGIDDRTLVLFTSDNGAPCRNVPQWGSNRPLKGCGYETSEAGMRVPCIVRWPGNIAAGSICKQLACTMDLLPTFASLAAATFPSDHVIDGKDIVPLLRGAPGAESPHEAFYYYHRDQLQAVRSGSWKLYLPLELKQRVGKSASFAGELYDLANDLGETSNVVGQYPDTVARLTAYAERARLDLGDQDRPGKNRRPAGYVANPVPQMLTK